VALIAICAVPSAIGITTGTQDLEAAALTRLAVLAALPLGLVLYVLLIARAVHVLQPSRVVERAVRRTNYRALRTQALKRYGGGTTTNDSAEDEALVGAGEIARRAVDDADVRTLKAFTRALVARLIHFAAEARRRSPSQSDLEIKAAVQLVLSDYFEPLFRRAAKAEDRWSAEVVVKAVETVGTTDLGPSSESVALAITSLGSCHTVVSGSPWADSVRARIGEAVGATRASASALSGQRRSTDEPAPVLEARGGTAARSERESGSS
jgi:hypothetical protein